MGLMKEYSYGTKQGNYFRIISLSPDTMHSRTNLKVALYTNKESRNKDVTSYVASMNYSLEGVVSDKSVAYKALKLMLDFKGSKDT